LRKIWFHPGGFCEELKSSAALLLEEEKKESSKGLEECPERKAQELYLLLLSGGEQDRVGLVPT